MKACGRPSIAVAVAVALLLSLTGIAAGIAAQTKPVVAAKPNVAAKPKLSPSPPPPGTVLDTTARYALILEADTNTVLFDKHAEERMPPASMSKIMTAYLAFGMLKEGRITLGDELPVSEKAWRLGGSKMFVGIGGRVKIEDLLKGMLIQSGNDACVVLAEGLAGSLANFIDQMNEKASRSGSKTAISPMSMGCPIPTIT